MGFVDKVLNRVDKETKKEINQKIAVGMANKSNLNAIVSNGPDRYDGYENVTHSLKTDKGNGYDVTIEYSPINEILDSQEVGWVTELVKVENGYEMKIIADFKTNKENGIEFSEIKMSEKKFYKKLENLINNKQGLNELYEKFVSEGNLNEGMDLNKLRQKEISEKIFTKDEKEKRWSIEAEEIKRKEATEKYNEKMETIKENKSVKQEKTQTKNTGLTP
jgi:hypothetical protein